MVALTMTADMTPTTETTTTESMTMASSMVETPARLVTKLTHCRKMLAAAVRRAAQLERAKRARKLRSTTTTPNGKDNVSAEGDANANQLEIDINVLKTTLDIDRIVYITLRNRLRRILTSTPTIVDATTTTTDDVASSATQDNSTTVVDNACVATLNTWAQVCIEHGDMPELESDSTNNSKEHDNDDDKDDTTAERLDAAIRAATSLVPPPRVENVILSSSKPLLALADSLAHEVRFLVRKIPNSHKRSFKAAHALSTNKNNVATTVTKTPDDNNDGNDDNDDGDSSVSSDMLSDSDEYDDDGNRIVSKKKKQRKENPKNRMGQRARQKLAERKYGKMANHVVKATGTNSTPLGNSRISNSKSTRTIPDKRVVGRGTHHDHHSVTRREVNNNAPTVSNEQYQRQSSQPQQQQYQNGYRQEIRHTSQAAPTTKTSNSTNESKPMHPSWEAKRAQALAAKKVMNSAPKAKKIVFNNDSDSD